MLVVESPNNIASGEKSKNAKILISGVVSL